MEIKSQKDNRILYVFDRKETQAVIQRIVGRQFLWEVKNHNVYCAQFKNTHIQIYNHSIMIFNSSETANLHLEHDDFRILEKGIMPFVKYP